MFVGCLNSPRSFKKALNPQFLCIAKSFKLWFYDVFFERPSCSCFPKPHVFLSDPSKRRAVVRRSCATGDMATGPPRAWKYRDPCREAYGHFAQWLKTYSTQPTIIYGWLCTVRFQRPLSTCTCPCKNFTTRIEYWVSIIGVILLCQAGPRGPMDTASDFESEDCGFESHRGRLYSFIFSIHEIAAVHSTFLFTNFVSSSSFFFIFFIFFIIIIIIIDRRKDRGRNKHKNRR